MSDRLRWRADSAWTGIAELGSHRGDGLVVDVLDRTPLATIAARPGRADALAERLRAELKCAPPGPNRTADGPAATLVWSAPDQWLAIGKAADALAKLAQALDGVAAVTEQTDSRAVLAVSGPSSRTLLAKGFAVDLHPSVFTTGSAAVTKVAYLSVQIWQTEETPSYRVSVPRSSAGTLWSWLTGAAGSLRAP